MHNFMKVPVPVPYRIYSFQNSSSLFYPYILSIYLLGIDYLGTYLERLLCRALCTGTYMSQLFRYFLIYQYTNILGTGTYLSLYFINLFII